jgi:hypothetical protein
MTKPQILWGDTKLIAIEKVSDVKLQAAFDVIDRALDGEISFGYAKFRADGFEFDGAGYRECRSNYNRLKRALILLSKELYIYIYTLTSDGQLSVRWMEELPKVKAVEVVERVDTSALGCAQTPLDYQYLRDTFMYYKWQPSLTINNDRQEIHDRVGCSKSYLDGRPESHPSEGLTAEQYEKIRKHNIKIGNLPTNYVEELSWI